MGEGSPEVRAVNRSVSIGFRGIDIFASRAKEFHGFLVWNVGESDGKEWLLIAVHSWTAAEIRFTIFVEL